jgi:hypothetical protein
LYRIGRTELQQAVDRLEPVSVLALLIYQLKLNYWPRRLSSEQFLRRLRRQANDRNGLQELVGKHNFIAEFLRARGYDVKTITINGEQPTIPVERCRLDFQTLKLVEAYRA